MSFFNVQVFNDRYKNQSPAESKWCQKADATLVHTLEESHFYFFTYRLDQDRHLQCFHSTMRELI